VNALGRWLRLSAIGVAAAAAVAGAGAALFDGEARQAFLAGTAASGLAALAGAVPLARAGRPGSPLGGGSEGIAAIGKATLARFLVAVAAALVAAVGWRLSKGPLFAGLAASYVAVLAAETGFLVTGSQSRRSGTGGPSRD
jgi:hypothetical protein